MFHLSIINENIRKSNKMAAYAPFWGCFTAKGVRRAAWERGDGLAAQA
jgi:hypothetical protein